MMFSNNTSNGDVVSENDTMMLHNEDNYREISDLLSTIIEQNDKNNYEQVFDTLIQQNESIVEQLRLVSNSILNVSTQNNSEMKKIISAMDTIEKFLPLINTLKGERGERGEKGDRGEKGEPGVNGKDGKTPVAGVDFPLPKNGKDASVDYELILETIKKIIPKPKDGKDGKDGSPDTGKDIVRKLTSLEGKDKLSYDDLKDTPNLEYLVRTFSARDYDFIELKDTPSSYAGSAGKIVRVNSSGTGLEFVTSSSSYTLVENEHPPESADDSRVNFTFLHTPIANSEKVFVGPGRMTVTAGDYTIAGTTITFTTPPPTGVVITFDYRY